MHRSILPVVVMSVCLGCQRAPADPAAELQALERTRASLLADLHAEREECRALAISLSAEPPEFRNKLVKQCFDAYSATADATAGTLRDLLRRIEELRKQTAERR